MVFRRRRFRRFRRRGFRKKKPIGMSWSSWAVNQVPKIWKVLKFVKGAINVEKKFFDVAYSAQSVDYTSPIISDLTAIAQGDTFETRDGNKIRLKSIYINLWFALPDAANYAAVRVMLLHDKQGVGTTPAITDILESTGSDAIVTSPLEKDVIARWEVMMNKEFTLDKDNNNSRLVKRFFKVSIPVTYNGTTSSDVFTNPIYLVMTSSEASAASSGNPPTVTGTVRMRFIDN